MKDRLWKLLELNERREKHVYPDSRRILTIGVGRNVDADRGGPGLRDKEIDFLLANDIDENKRDLARVLPWFPYVSEVHQAVLIDMLHNLGLSRFLKFKLFLQAMRQHDWPKAAQEMRNSLWWTQVKDRAPRLEKMVLYNAWPPGI